MNLNEIKIIQKINLKFIIAAPIFLAISICIFLANTENNAKAAIAPGCPSSRPTAITGTLRGYDGTYDGWSVNAQVGFDLHDSANRKIDIYGNVITNGGYSYTDEVNEDLIPPGSDSVLDQTFGREEDKGNGPLCVSSKVKTAWLEVYPKDENGLTTKVHYGGNAEHNMPVKIGATNRYTLRLPTSAENGGNTGEVNGYASYRSQSINPVNLQFRAFPYVVGSSCGVQGFSAAADREVETGATTYYLIKNLAAGQCGKAIQKYKIRATCKNACGSSSRTLEKLVDVAKGKRPRIDFKF